ncbi:MAG: hypothetical protein HY535_03825 [Chloroflexi bacterium]|nr:hypothetical protein [Chloroflexota bacterium]
MEYVLLGVLGFLAGYVFDLLAPGGFPWARRLLGAAAGGLLAFATVMVCVDSGRFWLPAGLQVAGWALLPGASLLLAYSLFWELPLAFTYWGRGRPARLITAGTYALVRHPTVLWYGLLLVSLLLVSRSFLLLFALPLWLALDILWAVLQERWGALAGMPDYASYRETTPMLIPNSRSVRAWWESYRRVPSDRGALVMGKPASGRG